MPEEKPKRERIWTQANLATLIDAFAFERGRDASCEEAAKVAVSECASFATESQVRGKLTELKFTQKSETKASPPDEREVEKFVSYLTDLAAFDAAAGTMLARKARASLAELLKAIKEGTLAKPADEVKDPDHDPDNAHVDLGIGEPPLVSA